MLLVRVRPATAVLLGGGVVVVRRLPEVVLHVRVVLGTDQLIGRRGTEVRVRRALHRRDVVVDRESEAEAEERHEARDQVLTGLEELDRARSDDQDERRDEAGIVDPVGQVGDALGNHLRAGAGLTDHVVHHRLAGPDAEHQVTEQGDGAHVEQCHRGAVLPPRPGGVVDCTEHCDEQRQQGQGRVSHDLPFGRTNC